MHLIKSILIFVGDPPEPEELIKALLSLENSASSDANIREQIANLPPEVSEIALLSKLEDKESAAKLIVQVNKMDNKIFYTQYCKLDKQLNKVSIQSSFILGQ